MSHLLVDRLSFRVPGQSRQGTSFYLALAMKQEVLWDSQDKEEGRR